MKRNQDQIEQVRAILKPWVADCIECGGVIREGDVTHNRCEAHAQQRQALTDGTGG